MFIITKIAIKGCVYKIGPCISYDNIRLSSLRTHHLRKLFIASVFRPGAMLGLRLGLRLG